MNENQYFQFSGVLDGARKELKTVAVETVDNDDVSSEQLLRLGLEVSTNGYIQWRQDCKDHPRNWKPLRKFYDTSLVMFLEFYT